MKVSSNLWKPYFPSFKKHTRVTEVKFWEAAEDALWKRPDQFKRSFSLGIWILHVENLVSLLQTMGSVDVPQEAFMAVLSIDRAQE